MRILALDQASRTSGWSYFEDGKLLSYGKFTYDDQDFGIRLYKIREAVKTLILKYAPDEVVYEDIQYQKDKEKYGVDTFKKLAEVYGVVQELLTEFKISHRAVLSTVWKSKLGLLKGYGQARESQKQAAQEWVVNNYKIKPTQDECDAICIGVWATATQPEKGFDWSE